MRFTLTDEQAAFRDTVREFATEEIEPRASELDRNEEYPAEILDSLGEMGLAGLTLSEEHGGEGGDLVDLVLAIEELSAAMMPVASALALHLGVATVVERFGTDEQAERFLPEMSRFETVGALGLSEEEAGSDKLSMETTAERDGDEWVLDGHKRWVTNFLDADVVLTYARTGPDEDAPHNISAFLVPTEAFEVDHVWETLGARSVKSPKVTLADVRVPDDRRIGSVGEAYVQRSRVDVGVNVPARAVGLARAALEDAVEHVTDRRQFDERIGDFQGVRWELAEMSSQVDAARLLTLRAADLADRGRDAGQAMSTAKFYATEAAVDVTNDALQLHGGVGYTAASDVERYLRDARLLTIAGGPNALHRDTVADAVLE
ncbi:acyl-CoA dehydrogenase family protein [Natronobacterium texcoconense]|uniref:Acyl-CoA dehydrogenase n=1 Tax=Natronobacterium texcoconense TaxID=1095778 RepID=A0A1H0ZDE6_NATTX|nr:acyl-CoA dehydrogenase family protein [Natronobacterium texcoconense]SDQ25515.1 Acyl-CoA dehydrogenase [Natronobacterium texcoconense]